MPSKPAACMLARRVLFYAQHMVSTAVAGALIGIAGTVPRGLPAPGTPFTVPADWMSRAPAKRYRHPRVRTDQHPRRTRNNVRSPGKDGARPEELTWALATD